MANRFNIDFSYPGLCSLCHEEIAEFDGFYKFGNSHRPKIKSLKPNFRQSTVKLSDGTFMVLSLCENCINFNSCDFDKIFQSELKGWAKEIEDIDWKKDDLKSIADAWYLIKLSVFITNKEIIGDQKWVK